jgi:Major Facilitator Superfamily
VSGRAHVIAGLLRDRGVRRLELAFAGFNVAEHGAWVAVLVYAYDQGGATAAALIAVCQLLPSGLVAPLAARFVDRDGGVRALRRSYRLQAGGYGITALLLLSTAPAPSIYGAAIIAASTIVMTRPAHAALLPRFAYGSQELTALAVLSGGVEAASVLAGPAAAGILIALGGPGAAVGCFALCVAASALLASRAVPGRGAASTPRARADVAAPARAAVRALRRDRSLTALVIMVAVQYLVIGVLDVLLVVLAMGVLGLGASGAGYLTAALGAGGVIGSLLAIVLIGSRRLAVALTAAATVWAVVLVVLGAWPTVAGAFLLLAAGGSARSLLDTSGRTILLRSAPPALRGRIFGLLEGMAMFALAVGSALVPALVALAGPAEALIVTGLLLSAITLATANAVQRVDAHAFAPALVQPGAG